MKAFLAAIALASVIAVPCAAQTTVASPGTPTAIGAAADGSATPSTMQNKAAAIGAAVAALRGVAALFKSNRTTTTAPAASQPSSPANQ